MIGGGRLRARVRGRSAIGRSAGSNRNRTSASSLWRSRRHAGRALPRHRDRPASTSRCGNAVEGEHEVCRRGRAPASARGSKRRSAAIPAGVAVVFLDQARGNPRRVTHDVFDRSRRGGGVLRIQRQHEDTLHAIAAQALEHLAQRRIPVAHRRHDAHLRQRCCTAAARRRVCTASGDPPSIHTAAYFLDTRLLRRGRITQNSNGAHNQRGNDTTRRSIRNSAR
jgi:hypothetical protein